MIMVGGLVCNSIVLKAKINPVIQCVRDKNAYVCIYRALFRARTKFIPHNLKISSGTKTQHSHPTTHNFLKIICMTEKYHHPLDTSALKMHKIISQGSWYRWGIHLAKWQRKLVATKLVVFTRKTQKIIFDYFKITPKQILNQLISLNRT